MVAISFAFGLSLSTVYLPLLVQAGTQTLSRRIIVNLPARLNKSHPALTCHLQRSILPGWDACGMSAAHPAFLLPVSLGVESGRVSGCVNGLPAQTCWP